MQRREKILILALLASIGVHLLALFATPEIDLSKWRDSTSAPLEATLTAPEPVVVLPPPKPRVIRRPVVKRPPAAQPPPILTQESAPISQAPIVNSPVNNDPSATLPLTEKTPVATENVQAPEAKPPARAELVFTGHQGVQEESVGQASLSWRADNNQYTATLKVRLYAFFEFILTSRGKITSEGLQPEQATTKRPRRDLTTMQFDWDAKTVTLSGGEKNTFPLIAGTQDQLSALHQLFFSPATKDNADIVIVSDRKSDAHHYRVNVETLVTPLGNLKTTHFREQRDGDSNFEFWLANEYQDLPVKISFTISDTPYNFVISKISVQQ